MTFYTSIIIICWLSLFVFDILVYENNRLTKKDKWLFSITYLVVGLAALMEWLGLKFNGNPNIPNWLLRLVKAFDYVLTPMAGGALIINFKGKSLWKKIIIGVILVNALFQLVSLFTGWMVSIDEMSNYHHGILYPVYIVIYIVIIVLIAVEVISFSTRYKRQNRLSLYAILLLALVGIAFQEIFGGEIRTAYITLTLGMIMMFIHLSEFYQLASDDKIEEQQKAITTDALTKAYNRYAYIDKLKEVDEKNLAEYVIFSIDINELKKVNDTLGHIAGDELIVASANTIMDTFGSKGECFRTGGDEFIVISKMSKYEAMDYKKRVEENAMKYVGEYVKEISLAVGWAAKSDYPDLDSEKLATIADEFMYKEKDEYYQEHVNARRE